MHAYMRDGVQRGQKSRQEERRMDEGARSGSGHWQKARLTKEARDLPERVSDSGGGVTSQPR